MVFPKETLDFSPKPFYHGRQRKQSGEGKFSPPSRRLETMFHYQTAEELRQAAQEEGVTLPLGGDLSPLGQELEVQGVKLPNRVAIQPMEGCDGTADGKPGELTLHRYDKFARSGAGLLWEEATAVWEEARANPRQLWIKEENVGAFQAMNQRIRELSQKENGFAPVIIMQATHSGRYSKPQGVPAPLIAYNNPLFEKDSPIPQERIVSDDYLHRLVERMGEAARLAQQAGFDGIDLKSCHRYLGSELLSAYNRPGDFGGSFENRTRFLRESVQAAKAAVTGGFLITSRLNVYDGFPYPYGFGVSTKGGLEPDLTEPLKLVGRKTTYAKIPKLPNPNCASNKLMFNLFGLSVYVYVVELEYELRCSIRLPFSQR